MASKSAKGQAKRAAGIFFSFFFFFVFVILAQRDICFILLSSLPHK